MSAHGEFAHTDKQTEIMRLVLAAADTGTPITFAELKSGLSYTASKQAVLCSLKVLEGHGFLSKQHHGNRTMHVLPTPKAYTTFRPTPGSTV